MTHNINMMPVIAGATKNSDGTVSDQAYEVASSVVRSLAAMGLISLVISDNEPSTPEEFSFWLKKAYYNANKLIVPSELKVYFNGVWSDPTPQFFSMSILKGAGIYGCPITIPYWNSANMPYTEGDYVCMGGTYYQSNLNLNNTTPPSSYWDVVSLRDLLGNKDNTIPSIDTPTLTVVKHTDRPDHFTLTVSPFASTPDGSFTHLGTTFEVYSDANFINRIWTVARAAVSTDPLSVEIKGLVHDGNVYFRVNQTATNNDVSDWATSGAYQHNTYNAPNVPAPSMLVVQSGDSSSVGTTDYFKLTLPIINLTPHTSTHWQVSTGTGFNSIVWEQNASASSQQLTMIITPHLGFSGAVNIRAKIGNDDVESDWKEVYGITFFRPEDKPVAKWLNPTSAFNADYQQQFQMTLDPTVEFIDSPHHQSTTWQISTTSNFSNIIWSSTYNANNKTTIPVTLDRATSGTLYARARFYFGGTTYGDWTANKTINYEGASSTSNPPSLPSNRIINQGVPFAWRTQDSNIAGHESTTWQIATDSGFNNIISELADNTSAKYAWGKRFDETGVFYGRVSYKINGTDTDWSTTMTFTVIP